MPFLETYLANRKAKAALTRENRRAEGSLRLQLTPSLRRSQCQDPIVTDAAVTYAACCANLLTGYLNVMILEPKASAKYTNLYKRENFVFFPVITPLFAER